MKRNHLLILGAGQYGQVVRETAEAMGCFQKIDFLDDSNPIALAKLEDYKSFCQTYGNAFVAMGNPQLRLQWLEKLEKAGFNLPVLIHPAAYVSPSAMLEGGSIAEPMAVVHTDSHVGRGGLLCAGCVVNHNSVLEACCQIDCGAAVSSNARVPEGTKVKSCTVYERK